MEKKGALVISQLTGAIVALTLDEYRLALLGRVDFEDRWAALEAAAQYVVDGDAKTAAIRANLLPIAEHLTEIGQKVDSLELLAARHWFRNLPSTPTQPQAAAAAGQEAV
ncbi:MAG: hypothetical protein NT169_18615 [Chloroflexi bacterium]|nr:hypothetical protein [Chloroflexota bacterium]